MERFKRDVQQIAHRGGVLIVYDHPLLRQLLVGYPISAWVSLNPQHQTQVKYLLSTNEVLKYY